MPKGLPEEIPAAKRKLGKSATTCVCGGGGTFAMQNHCPWDAAFPTSFSSPGLEDSGEIPLSRMPRFKFFSSEFFCKQHAASAAPALFLASQAAPEELYGRDGGGGAHRLHAFTQGPSGYTLQSSIKCEVAGGIFFCKFLQIFFWIF